MPKTLLFLEKLLTIKVWRSGINDVWLRAGQQQIQVILGAESLSFTGRALPLKERIPEVSVQQNLIIINSSLKDEAEIFQSHLILAVLWEGKMLKFTFFQPLALSQPSCHRETSELVVHLLQEAEEKRGFFTLNFMPCVKKCRNAVSPNNPFLTTFVWANISCLGNFVGKVEQWQEKEQKSSKSVWIFFFFYHAEEVLWAEGSAGWSWMPSGVLPASAPWYLWGEDVCRRYLA